MITKPEVTNPLFWRMIAETNPFANAARKVMKMVETEKICLPDDCLRKIKKAIDFQDDLSTRILRNEANREYAKGRIIGD